MSQTACGFSPRGTPWSFQLSSFSGLDDLPDPPGTYFRHIEDAALQLAETHANPTDLCPDFQTACAPLALTHIHAHT